MTPSIRLALLAACAFPLGASAATCTVTATALTFGVYDVFAAAPRDAVSTIRVECTPGVGDPSTVGYTIRLADTGGSRMLRSSGATLAYQLYADAARLQVWGDGGTQGASVSSSVPTPSLFTPAARTHDVYGRIAVRQVVRPGQYATTVSVTVDY